MSGASGIGVKSIARLDSPWLSAADNQNVSSLLVGSAWDASNITFSFPESSDVYGPQSIYSDSAPYNGFSTLTTQQRGEAMRLLPGQQLHRVDLHRDHRDDGYACGDPAGQFLNTADGLRLLSRHLPTGRRHLLRWDRDPIGTVSGSDRELESRDPIFRQDLNGDGAIGLTNWLL
jgi:hypothetical protein